MAAALDWAPAPGQSFGKSFINSSRLVHSDGVTEQCAVQPVVLVIDDLQWATWSRRWRADGPMTGCCGWPKEGMSLRLQNTAGALDGLRPPASFGSTLINFIAPDGIRRLACFVIT